MIIFAGLGAKRNLIGDDQPIRRKRLGKLRQAAQVFEGVWKLT
jgi:hypothetical protein